MCAPVLPRRAPSSCAGGSSLASRRLAAAGGGGGGRGGADTGDADIIKGGSGGAGGVPGGAGAFDSRSDSGGEGGQPGGVASGGAAGEHSAEPATAGQLGLGGSGGTSFAAGGGGGGGGVFGGGGGGGGGGLAFAEVVSPFNVFNSAGGGGGGGGSGVPAGAGGVSGFSLAPTIPGAQPSATFSWTLPPPTPVTGTPAAVTSTSATLTGTVNPDGTVVSDCHFLITPAPPGGGSVPCAQQVGAASTPVAVSATVAGLSPADAYTVTLVASSAQGSGSGSAVGFATLAASASGTPALTVLNLRLSASRFHRGKHAAVIAKARSKAPSAATTISFGLSGAATVTITFQQAGAGVIVGRKCAAASAARRRGRRCTLYRAVSRAVTRPAHAGTDRVSFDGVLDGGARLAPGSYRLTLSAADGDASVTASQRPMFTLLS